MDIEEIRLSALDEFGGPERNLQQATNKMSDVLGFMWRRGVLTRYPAPKDSTSFARFSYTWNEKPEPDARPIPPPPSPLVGKSKLNIIQLKNMLALRQQDMLTLKWADFQKEHIDSFIKKVSKDIRFANTEEIGELLSKLKKNGELLFPMKNGEQMDKNAFEAAWWRVMLKYRKAGGERFTEHDIRGKVATDIDDPYQAQKILAHSSIAMTESYIKQRKKTVVQPYSRKKKDGEA